MTFSANIKSMGSTLRRNVVKPFHYGESQQKYHKSTSGLIHPTTSLENNIGYGHMSLSKISSDGYSDSGHSGSSKRTKSFYETLPTMFGGIHNSSLSRSVSKSVKKSKKVGKLIKARSEKVFHHNLTLSEKSKTFVNKENVQVVNNNDHRIDEETENDLNADRVSSNGISFTVENEYLNESGKNDSATGTPVFRVPDILVKQRFDRLKYSKSVSTTCSFTATKSLATSTSSLSAITGRTFRSPQCSAKSVLLSQHQSFNNNYECNGFSLFNIFK